MHNGTLLKSFRKQPRTNNWTFHSDIHGTWVNTSNQFLVPCNNLFLQGETVPKPKTEDELYLIDVYSYLGPIHLPLMFYIKLFLKLAEVVVCTHRVSLNSNEKQDSFIYILHI